MTRKLTRAQIRVACENACGTTRFVGDFLPEGIEIDDLSFEELAEIGKKIFICNECGWTCDIDELADDGGEGSFCQTCYENRE